MYPKLGEKAFIIDFTNDRNEWFYKKFYINGKRKITQQFFRHINSYGLAIWFMDDGNLVREGYKQICLNTQAYSFEEHKLLQRMFKKRFDLSPKIHKDKKYFKLYFGTDADNANRFRTLIKPYIHPLFEYKLR